MTTPKIPALGVMQKGTPTRGKAKPRFSRLKHSYLSHWPLMPPSILARPWVWLMWGMVACALDAVTPPKIDLMPLGLIPILLAAWSGSLPWAVGLACVLPWGGMVDWYWYQAPWSVWVEVLDALCDVITYVVAAVLMVALQRHAVRLAIERNPRLPKVKVDDRARGH
jgi:hypothetical protein